MQIDLMILGVEKAGTTALFRHLAQSPSVYAHPQREMFGFLSDDEYGKGWPYITNKYFHDYTTGLVVAKNVMQLNSTQAMLRLKEHCPDVKCIIMLREPASRAYSAYNYAVLRGAETCPTFEQAMEMEDDRARQDPSANNPLLYLRNSTYAEKVRLAMDIYGRERVLVIYNEEYKKDPRGQLSRVERFIGKPLFDNVSLEFKDHNRSAKARFPRLSKVIYYFLTSKNPAKKMLRSLFSHSLAVKLRHTVLNFNRVEGVSKPLSKETARLVRERLATDSHQLVDIVGYCPWVSDDY